MGGWAKGWGGGPAQMLSRVYTWYIPGISIYLVYTRYILPPQTPIPGILPAIRMTVLRVPYVDYALSMHMASKHKLKLNVDKE